jgi:hypothetical protein
MHQQGMKSSEKFSQEHYFFIKIVKNGKDSLFVVDAGLREMPFFLGRRNFALNGISEFKIVLHWGNKRQLPLS